MGQKSKQETKQKYNKSGLKYQNPVLGLPMNSKRYIFSHSETGCQIYTIPISSFLRVTLSSIYAFNLPTSLSLAMVKAILATMEP